MTTAPSGLPPMLRPSKTTQVIAATVLCLFSIFALAGLNLVGMIFADRLDDLLEQRGIAPGTDLTLMIAELLMRSLKLAEPVALATSSFLALPVLMAIAARLAPTEAQPLIDCLLLCSSPLVIAGIAGGYGWAILGLYALWRALIAMPALTPERAMPIAGLGIALGYMSVPGFSGLLLPIAAMLFLCAPRTLLRQHMRVFYILSFTPTAMVAASFAYADWLFQGHPPSLPTIQPDLGRLLLRLAVIVLSGPALFRATIDQWDQGSMAVFSILVLTALLAPLPLFVTALAASVGHMALRAHRAESTASFAMGWMGGFAVLFALDATAMI